MTRVLFEDKNAVTMKKRTYELEARIQRLCTAGILIAHEACGWVPSLEVEVHV